MKRPYNFSAGPSGLPLAVLEMAQGELFNWQNTGVSALEIGHRTPEGIELIARVEDKLRQIMHIPTHYRVLLLHGGAQGQFAAIPMNLLGNNNKADYLVSGVWSAKAAKQAQAYGDIQLAFDGQSSNYLTIADDNTWQLRDDAAYVYYCENETIAGLQFPTTPQTGQVPLVADVTSSILTKPFNVENFGLLFASAQKTLSTAGVTLVIVRDDLLSQAQTITPNIWRYDLQAQAESCVNTPAVYPIYMMDLMLDWLIEQGGVTAMADASQRKSERLYDFIDNSDYYQALIEPTYRSSVNVSFVTPDEQSRQRFLQQAEQQDLRYLRGHKLLGGLRASLYNAMPQQGVDTLIEFMAEFEKSAS